MTNQALAVYQPGATTTPVPTLIHVRQTPAAPTSACQPGLVWKRCRLPRRPEAVVQASLRGAGVAVSARPAACGNRVGGVAAMAPATAQPQAVAMQAPAPAQTAANTDTMMMNRAMGQTEQSHARAMGRGP